MRVSAVTLTLLCIVSSTCLYGALGNTQYRNLAREKRQDDSRWIQVVPPNITRNNQVLDITEPPEEENNTNEPNPCLTRLNLLKPDFSAPGRRISETKCYDYIWEVKVRHENEKKSTACRRYKQTRNGLLRPSFAIGGRDAFPAEFPHMGAVGWKAAVGTWKFLCGSSLISPKFMLTAAHCSRVSSRDTSVADPVPKIVRLGDRNIIDVADDFGVGPTDVNITKIIVHPNYKSPKKYDDIALLELEQEMKFTKAIQPACLWTHFDTSNFGLKATLTGWGVIETVGRTTSPILQAAEVDIIDTDTCNNLLRPLCNRNWCGVSNQICAGKMAGGVDACQGDSGGPLQVKIPLPITTQGSMHHVIGVTSFGLGCARANTPGIYTRVSSYIDWIEGIVWKEL